MKRLKELFSVGADILSYVGGIGFLTTSVVSLFAWILNVPKFWLGFALGAVTSFGFVLIAVLLVRFFERMKKPSELVTLQYAYAEYPNQQLQKRARDTFATWLSLDAAIGVKRHELSMLNRKLRKTPSTENVLKEQIQQAKKELEDLTDRQFFVSERTDFARLAVKGDFFNQLKSGKLIALAYPLPMKHGEPHVEIPKFEWTFLEINLDNEIASGQGIEYKIIGIKRR